MPSAELIYKLVRFGGKFVLFVVTLGILGFSGLKVFDTLKQLRSGGSGTAPVIGEGDSDLSDAERVYLSGYLSLHATELEQPASADNSLLRFTVAPGDTVKQVAENLQEAGLITNAELLRYYMRYYGLDKGVAAGDFLLSPSMTIPQIAGRLGRALASDIALRFTEGWRAEQVGAEIAATQGLTVSAQNYMALVVPGADLTRYDVPFIGDLPAGAGLEGFLFPDTYQVTPDATAQDIVARQLANFDQRVTADMRAAYGAQGLTLYQAVILASIVEREAVVEEERPLIASVYLNRLKIDMKLDADPTVQYALGYQADSGQWWKRPLSFDDLQFDSPYNTYINQGLPPGPIANPGLSSLQAIAAPAQTAYYYFRATCDGSGHHNFSETFEQHNAYACP